MSLDVPADIAPDLLRALDEPPSGNTTISEPFWLVVCTEVEWKGREGQWQHLTRGYKAVHYSEESANAEALRLATRYRGFAFAVCKGLAAVHYADNFAARPKWEEFAE